MKEHFAKPGDVGLIYTDEAGKYHILALSPEQHQALQLFVASLTKEQPAVMADKYEVVIRKKPNPTLKLHYYGTSLAAVGHYFWNISENGKELIAWNFNGWDILPFHIETLVPTATGAKTAYGVVTDNTGLATTYLAFAGSPSDKRPGSVSVFFSAGEHSEEEMTEAIKKTTICPLILKLAAKNVDYTSESQADQERINAIINNE